MWEKTNIFFELHSTKQTPTTRTYTHRINTKLTNLFLLFRISRKSDVQANVHQKSDSDEMRGLLGFCCCDLAGWAYFS